jgi:hypothetical protein
MANRKRHCYIIPCLYYSTFLLASWFTSLRCILIATIWSFESINQILSLCNSKSSRGITVRNFKLLAVTSSPPCSDHILPLSSSLHLTLLSVSQKPRSCSHFWNFAPSVSPALSLVPCLACTSLYSNLFIKCLHVTKAFSVHPIFKVALNNPQ